MPTRARAEADAAAAAEGKVKQPRGRKPTGYQIWDGTPPGTWRNERGEAYQPGAPSHEVEAPMPAELVGVVTQTDGGFDGGAFVAVGEVMPYLLRRAQENSSLLGSVAMETRMLRQEITRRAFG